MKLIQIKLEMLLNQINSIYLYPETLSMITRELANASSDRYESLSRSLPKLKFKYFEISFHVLPIPERYGC
jgi:hypothetical protein